MKYEQILNRKWEDIVGRKGSPLRLYFNYVGFSRWFESKFGVELNEPNISFCVFRDGLVTTDNFLNIVEKEIILSKIKGQIVNMDKAFKDINHFKEVSEKLIKVSMEIRDNSGKFSSAKRFKMFWESWIDFSPAYIGIIYYEKILQRLIIDNYENKDLAHNKLIEYITADFESDFFKIKRKEKQLDDFFEKKDKPLLELMKLIVKVRDFRKYACDLSWDQLLFGFFMELSEKTSLNEFLFWVFPGEIEQRLVTNKPYKKYPAECLIFFDKGKISIEYNDNFKALKEKVLNIKSTDLIHGQSAFGGFAKGKVKILMPNDKKEINKGEVLVTKMTTPDFVPVMKKVAAIITDEGGVTCHAAVIAREMKKPCIIGAKVATKVLKDGDMVEVDADKGIIKMLKQ